MGFSKLTAKILLLQTVFLPLFGAILVNRETGRIVVEFLEDEIVFNDRFLEIEMKETGIYIPRSRISEFENKGIVYLGDPLFQRAFRDVYYEYAIANSLYDWQEDSNEHELR